MVPTAVMFNGGALAQVLEGPRTGVEETFERIQCDDRHGDGTVLQCGPVEQGGFANWSMALVGQSARGQTLWKGLAAESGFDLSRMSGDAVFSMVQGLVLEEEGTPVAAAPAVASSPALPVEQVRAEIAQLRPDLAGFGSATEAAPATHSRMVLPDQRTGPQLKRGKGVLRASGPLTLGARRVRAAVSGSVRAL
ncbi:BLUF domain-containing protein [Methylobacterium oryzisoli]|uniref:BLUF domain-containing protein n=1 Tax=Methylobacterium oryzisoli TaxID=3385502 RepID=UPI003892C338